jgi:hypothetical protein
MTAGRSYGGQRRSLSHAGSALLAQIADKSGLTQAVSVRLEGLTQRRSGHDPGRHQGSRGDAGRRRGLPRGSGSGA